MELYDWNFNLWRQREKCEDRPYGHIGRMKSRLSFRAANQCLMQWGIICSIKKKINIIQCCNYRATSCSILLLGWITPGLIKVTGVAWICCACCPPLLPNCFHSYGLQIPSAVSICTKGDWESFFSSGSISLLPGISLWLAAYFNVTLFPAVKVLRFSSKTHTNLDLIWDDAITFEIVWLSEKTSTLARLSS